MQHYLVLTILIICYVSVNSQTDHTSTTTATTGSVTVHTTVVEHTTVVPVVVAVEKEATVQTTVTTTTVVPFSTTTGNRFTSINRALVTSWPEPPPHPLGYCIRGRLRCSKIRRCCTGPCNFNTMKCPSP
ncbi:unnamed protein product [Adineta ricciae]|uniref:WAP domain-containing protein n=1 Tax=Adineta ricciae TaxID=249248 RepID=A0A814PIQ0_ADIRI|nr:unnamed protein product [Adineta ricciae]CAF1106682.1 unnamed protein product [Adineta ricciae]